MTTKDTFHDLQNRMDANPARLAGMNAVYQFVVIGADPGAYSLAIVDGKAQVSEGTHAVPSVTLTIATPDFAEMVAGRLDVMSALMSGKLKRKGDMRLAIKLQDLIK